MGAGQKKEETGKYEGGNGGKDVEEEQKKREEGKE
jgi:hypothetical protein